MTEKLEALAELFRQRAEIDGRILEVLGGGVKLTRKPYKKRKPKGYAKKTPGGKLNWKSLNKLRELKAGGMTSKDAADEIGKSLEMVNAAWGNL